MTQAPSTRRVLVVDDDERIRDLLCELFAGKGYEVLTAADGLQAWEHLTASDLPLIVVLDEVLPGMRGLALLARVAADRQLATRHGYLLLTATANHLQAHSLPLPVPIVPKPCSLADLLALVAQTAEQLQQ